MIFLMAFEYFEKNTVASMMYVRQSFGKYAMNTVAVTRKDHVYSL